MPRGLKRADVQKTIMEQIADDVGVFINKGNDKLDDIPNISLVPGETCPGSVEECKYCYAKHCMRCSTWAEVRWRVNTWYAMNSLRRFFDDVCAQIYLSRTDYFRIHVGGDFFNQEYLNMWMCLATKFTHVKFLAFTKSFHLDWRRKPDNLTVIWSMFPSTDLSKVPPGPRAYTIFPNIDYPVLEPIYSTAYWCTGTCRSCGMCYHAEESHINVKFKAHGPAFKKARPRGEDGKWLPNSSIEDE